jgi:hypothetical protein
MQGVISQSLERPNGVAEIEDERQRCGAEKFGTKMTFIRPRPRAAFLLPKVHSAV